MDKTEKTLMNIVFTCIAIASLLLAVCFDFITGVRYVNLVFIIPLYACVMALIKINTDWID